MTAQAAAHQAAGADLGGKAVLVTGGSGGIGAASARLFAGAGAAVTITHRPGKEVEGAAVLATLPGTGHAALPLQVDDSASVTALRDAVAARAGPAGRAGQQRGLHQASAARRSGRTG